MGNALCKALDHAERDSASCGEWFRRVGMEVMLGAQDLCAGVGGHDERALQEALECVEMMHTRSQRC